MEKFGVNQKEILYIGDSIYDQECALRSGVDFGLAGWGTKKRPEEILTIFEKPEEILKMLISRL